MSTGGGAEQASETPRAGRLGFWRTCGVPAERRYKLQHAPMLRGIEARGSEHFRLRIQRKLECARTLGVPRALGTFEAAADGGMSEGLPGADTRIRAMVHVRDDAPPFASSLPRE